MSINPFTLTFRDPDFENDFVNEFIVQRFLRERPKKIRIALHFLIVFQYIAYQGMQLIHFKLTATDPTLPPSVFGTTSFLLSVVIFFRVAMLLQKIPKLNLSAAQTEIFDQFLFVGCVVLLAVSSAYQLRYDSNYFFIAIIEGPIVCPSRVSRTVISVLVGAILYTACMVGMGNPTAYEILMTSSSCLLVSVWQLIALGKIEYRYRENVLLRRQMEENFDDQMRLSEECLKHEQEASNTKQRMVNMITHELRTPAQGISAMSSMLIESRDLSRADRESALIIKRGSDLLVALINDFLDMSRLESDQISFKKEPVDLAEIAEDTLDMISQSIYCKGKRVEAFYSVQPSVSRFVLSDRQRLNQILLNLASNAAKYCHHGHIHISFSLSTPDPSCRQSFDATCTPYSPTPSMETISTTYTVPTLNDITQPMLCISVHDSGAGLRQESLPNLFQEFFMVEEKKGATKPQGTGLGLAIVKRTALGMGGTVQVSSKGLGCGSTLRVFLPYLCVQNIARRPSPATMPQTPPISERPSRRNRNGFVFLVNSNDLARESAMALVPFPLRCFGFSSLGQLSEFLVDMFPRIEQTEMNNDRESRAIVLIDENAWDPDSSEFGFLKAQSKSLENSKLRFVYALISPLHDSFGPSTLQTHGFFTKIPKPIRRKKLETEIHAILSVESPRAYLYVPITHPHPDENRRRSLVETVHAWVGSRRLGSPQPDMAPMMDVGPTALEWKIPGIAIDDLHQRDTSTSTSVGDKLPLVLIVDDNHLIQHAFMRMLKSSGFAFDTANDGKEALEKVENNRYDCILMDFQMDGMDGMTATRLIRQRHDHKRHVPIIGLSGETDEESHKSALGAGMTMVLSKPVHKQELALAIKSVLKKK